MWEYKFYILVVEVVEFVSIVVCKGTASITTSTTRREEEKKEHLEEKQKEEQDFPRLAECDDYDHYDNCDSYHNDYDNYAEWWFLCTIGTVILVHSRNESTRHVAHLQWRIWVMPSTW